MFGSNNIRKHVMVAVNQMIEGVQKRYDDRVEEIEKEAEALKLSAREEAVESIISKFR